VGGGEGLHTVENFTFTLRKIYKVLRKQKGMASEAVTLHIDIRVSPGGYFILKIRNSV
jgi:hypothetical protein